MVAAGVSDEMLVQVSYAIGVAEPVSIYVNTYGRSKVDMTDGEIAKKIAQMFDLRPKAVERQLKLRQPMFWKLQLTDIWDVRMKLWRRPSLVAIMR